MLSSEECKEIRWEWNNSPNKIFAQRNLGKVCFNCGSDEGTELHHIVPLKLGGTNNISNIAVLCHKCHRAAHFGQHINEHRETLTKDQVSAKIKKAKKIKRQKRIIEQIAFQDYTHGRIGLRECRTRIGKPGKSSLFNLQSFREYCEIWGIADIENKIDKRLALGEEPKLGQKIGHIIYTNGKKQDLYWDIG